MNIDYQPYWKPFAILEAIGAFQKSLLLCITTTVDELNKMYEMTFERKRLQSLISYQDAKDRYEENESSSKFIEETKIKMAKTEKFFEQLRVAVRIDKLLVEQLNEAHLNSLDSIMKAINRLIPLLFDNNSRRVLLVFVMKGGSQYTYDFITAMNDIVSVFIIG